MIADYLWAHRPQLARATLLAIVQHARLLLRFPEIGMVSEHHRNARRLFLLPLPYVLFYFIDEYAVTLVQIRHTSQDWIEPRQ